MVIATKEQAECLAQYVEAGGILVIGCRSGYKDVNGKCVMEKLPGVLSELTGTDISEYSMIAPDTGKVTIDWGGTELEANVFADLLKPVHGGFLKGTYTADYYAGSGAVTSRKMGKGKTYYYGSAWNEDTAEIFLEKLGVKTPYKELIEAPECCEIAVRRKGEKRFLFILNYAKEESIVILKTEMKDLYTGKRIKGNISLKGYEVRVILLEE